MNVTCPTQSTTTVKAECITRQDEDYYYNEASDSCYKVHKTTCANSVFGTNTTKTTLVNVTCPTHSTPKEGGNFDPHLLTPLILYSSKSLGNILLNTK